MLRLFFTIILVLPICGLAQYPKAKTKPSSDFKQKTRQVETDNGSYVLVTYEGKPYKKPPFKDWEYINPVDSLTNPKERLDYCLTKGHLLNDTAYLFPYYQKAGFIEADEYFEFYEYARDSIVLLEIGGAFIKTDRAGNRRIDWIEAKKKLDYSDHATVNLISALLNSSPNKIESEHVIDKRKITYMGSTKYHSFQTFSNCQYQRLSNGDPIRLWDGYREVKAQKFSSFYGIRPYPDTFLWASPRQMNIDSSMAVGLANYGTPLKNGVKWPLLDKNRACAYTHWHSSQLRLELEENSNEIKFFFDVDSSASHPIVESHFTPIDLHHFRITYSDYVQFLKYCHDSIVSQTTRKYLDKWRESGSFEKCYALSRDSLLKVKGRCLRYYWEWVDQPVVNDRKFRHNPKYTYRREFIFLEEESVWNGSVWDGLLHKRLPKTLRHQTIDSLSFRQATAYWHWRVHIKMKDKKKALADYLTPTYAQWKDIQSGGSVEGRTVKMPYPRRKFTYRVYVHL